MALDPSPDHRKVTLADIAELSGVSIATVSLVLRNKPGVGEETRRRVYDVAQSLGYIHSASNQAQASRLPHEVGLVIKIRVDDIPTTNSFYQPVLSGIEAVCRHNNINLLYTNLPVDRHNCPLEVPRLLQRRELDGVLLVGINLDAETVSAVEAQNAATVLVDAYAEGSAFDSVVTDNSMGAYRATCHLIAAGHRHVAILGSEPDAYPSVRERRNGYERAMAQHGLPPIYADCLLHPEHVPAAATKLLRDRPEVTAVFACNDDVAIALMRIARQIGRRIPQDLAVVGFDNISLAQHLSPALSTMSVDMMGMGRLAAQLMLNRFEFPHAGRVRSVICPQFIERDSG